MIPYIGDFVAGTTVRYYFASNAAAGASSARTTAGTYRVYKNISTTERTSSAGITDYSSFDTVTGLNAVTIDLSNNTDAGFYATGNDYVVVLVGAVVDSQTLNVPLFQFSIENRKNIIGSAVWDDTYASHTTAGTFGKLMDILRKSNYVTEGTTTSGSTSTVINTNLSGYLVNAFDNQTILFLSGTLIGVSGIINGTSTNASVLTLDETLPAAPASGIDFVILANHVHTKNGIADSLLSRTLDSSSNGTDTTDERTVRSALRAMRNKVVVSNGTMTVYKENDSTVSWSGTVSNTANVTVDPT